MAKTQAWLKSVSRGFGSDSATYEIREEGNPHELTINVSWALLSKMETIVTQAGKEVARFSEKEYVQPPEALVRMGYEVHGIIDFAKAAGGQ